MPSHQKSPSNEVRVSPGAMQAITRTPPGCQYNIEVLSESVECIDPPAPETDWANLPKHAKWVKTADFPAPPPVGTRVRVRINKLGTGTVQGYFVEHGWVGVHVLPDQRPDWHVKQNGPEKNYYLVFGIEIEAIGGCALSTSIQITEQESRPEFPPKSVKIGDVAVGTVTIHRSEPEPEWHAALKPNHSHLICHWLIQGFGPTPEQAVPNAIAAERVRLAEQVEQLAEIERLVNGGAS